MKSLSGFLLFCCLTACGEIPLTVSYQQPAKKNLDFKTNYLAVFPETTGTPQSSEVLDQLTSEIEQKVIEAGSFKVVDLGSRSLREEMIKKSLEESVTSRDEELLRLGHELNASLLITPLVDVAVNTRRDIKQRTIRLGTGFFYDIFYKTDEKIRVEKTREVVVEDEYEIRTLSTSGYVRLIDVETGEVFATVKVKRQNHRSKIKIKDGAKDIQTHFFDFLGWIFGAKKDIKPEHPLVLETIGSFVSDLSRRTVNIFSPVNLPIETVIYKNGDLGTGTRLARADQWPQAVERWERILAEEPDNPRCLHNLSVGYIALNDLEKSRLYLIEAIALEDNEHSIELLKEVEKLSRQLKEDPPANDTEPTESPPTLNEYFEEDDFFDD